MRSPVEAISRDWTERAYRALFLLLPAAFRSRFAEEMLELFRVRRAAASARSARAGARVVVMAVADLVAAAWRERWPRPAVAGPARSVFSTEIRDDLRAAARRLRRAPGLSLTVIGLLALTIGSATVVFSVVNAVLLRPLPYSRPDRIMLIWETRANVRQNVVGAHEFPVWARANTSFSDMAAIIFNEGVHLTGAGDPKAMLGVRVSEPFFRVMGVSPAIGRTFTKEEDAPGRGQVAVISDRLWRERFGGQSSALGRDIVLDGQPHRIVGVMPPVFAFPPARFKVTPDVWVPIAENIEPYRGRHYLYVIGRLNDAMTIGQAEADLSVIAAALAKDLPDVSNGHGVNVMPLQDHLVHEVRSSLLLLLGAVGCLLLIGCSNVASLLLARGLVRRREVSLELALGATRLRVARQLLAESVVMSMAGGALGLVLAFGLTRLVPALVPPGLLTVETITVDRFVLYFVAGCFGPHRRAVRHRAGDPASARRSRRDAQAGRAIALRRTAHARAARARRGADRARGAARARSHADGPRARRASPRGSRLRDRTHVGR